jgi:peptidoglycan/LPS O-acetylase OafA/YrhL
MDSPNRPRNHEVDELRGAAALLVLFYHSVHSGAAALGFKGWLTTSWVLPAVLYEGHSGVALFMVLSGYILATGTFDKEIIYSGFLRNRALRIFPLMVVVLVFALYATKSLDLGKILAPFFLLANTDAAFSDPVGLAGTVWTISVEFQFYLIAPFLFALTAQRGLSFILSAVLLFWLLRMIATIPLWDTPAEMYRISYFTIVGRINQFLMGIGLAYLFSKGGLQFLSPQRSALGFVVSVAAMVALLATLNSFGGITVWSNWRIVYPEIEALVWAGFIAGYLALKPLKGLVLDKGLYAIGQISFSMYIIHYGIQRGFWLTIYPKFFHGYFQSGLGILFLTLTIAIVVTAISSLSYRLIEKPFIDMRGKYLTPLTAR